MHMFVHGLGGALGNMSRQELLSPWPPGSWPLLVHMPLAALVPLVQQPSFLGGESREVVVHQVDCLFGMIRTALQLAEHV